MWVCYISQFSDSNRGPSKREETKGGEDSPAGAMYCGFTAPGQR